MLSLQFIVEVFILLLTVFAIIYGPIRAVKITRDLDDTRQKQSRQYAILSDLMRTRRARLDVAHVAALNLIELEFYGKDKIIEAYRSYASHLNSHFPEERDALQRHLSDGDGKFSELLRLIALELGYNFDKGDLDRLSYLPQGLGTHYDNSMVNAQLMREVLEGRRSIPITNFISNNNLFPPTPPPRADEQE